MKTYSYYPGCSQLSSAEEYGVSALEVADALGIRLETLPDWNCCGASSAHMTNHLLAVSLPGRNLARARERGGDLVVVCAACYHNLKKAQTEILEDEKLARRVEAVVGADPRFRGRIVHLLDVIAEEVGLEDLVEKVTRPLEGLKPVSYYGCLMVRPRGMITSDDPDNPRLMDDLMTALGAEVKNWSYKTDCCGGSLSLTRTDVVVKLVNRLFEAAEEAGGNCIVVACPMCLANLEMRQREGRLSFKLEHDLPVFFFTEMLGLALGLPGAEEWFTRHLIDPLPLLYGAGLA
ncbi:MAG: CoB--CoM heterodisulfide reductase iron-sulfur subunit B family protein [Actinomycetota bacterium]|nr:CoB--CoM heterodisulfide reductase iron-sulfur subunit B family protein [Actinomycetota bacterium]MDD5666207.1 CoB--CoM heterodisulfide reductase iron-sulfur subunit B family protein [Actinomycetota bacterium]